MTISKTQVFTAESNGAQMTATIDRCAWMHPAYGLQLTVKMGNSCPGTLNNKALRFELATIEDIQQMLKGIRVVACKECAEPVFDPATVLVNGQGKCFPCVMKELDAELEESTRLDADDIAQRDAKYKKEGCTHRVEAWVHPASGDDWRVSFWIIDPTDEAIQEILRKETSQVLDDYTLFKL